MSWNEMPYQTIGSILTQRGLTMRDMQLSVTDSDQGMRSLAKEDAFLAMIASRAPMIHDGSYRHFMMNKPVTKSSVDHAPKDEGSFGSKKTLSRLQTDAPKQNHSKGHQQPTTTEKSFYTTDSFPSDDQKQPLVFDDKTSHDGVPDPAFETDDGVDAPLSDLETHGTQAPKNEAGNDTSSREATSLPDNILLSIPVAAPPPVHDFAPKPPILPHLSAPETVPSPHHEMPNQDAAAQLANHAATSFDHLGTEPIKPLNQEETAFFIASQGRITLSSTQARPEGTDHNTLGDVSKPQIDPLATLAQDTPQNNQMSFDASSDSSAFKQNSSFEGQNGVLNHAVESFDDGQGGMQTLTNTKERLHGIPDMPSALPLSPDIMMKNSVPTHENAATATSSILGIQSSQNPGSNMYIAPKGASLPLMVDQILNKLEKMDAPFVGEKTLSIELFPESLGKVDIRLEFSKPGHVTATFASDKAETLALLLRDEKNIGSMIQKVLGDGLTTTLNFHFQQGHGQSSQRYYLPSDISHDLSDPMYYKDTYDIDPSLIQAVTTPLSARINLIV